MAKRSAVNNVNQRPVEYYPPGPQEIDQYALSVCRELGEKLDSSYNSPDVRRELAGFLKIVAAICTKQLNQNGDKALDRDHPQR